MTKVEFALAVAGVSMLALAALLMVREQPGGPPDEVADSELEAMFAPAAGGNDPASNKSSFEEGQDQGLSKADRTRRPSLLLKLREASQEREDDAN